VRFTEPPNAEALPLVLGVLIIFLTPHASKTEPCPILKFRTKIHSTGTNFFFPLLRGFDIRFRPSLSRVVRPT